MTIRSSLLLACGVLGLVAPNPAQVVPDGATNRLSDVTNDIPGNVTVGTNGSFTLLVLSDNALLTNSTTGVIGANATARSNQVHLISPSARWLMGGNLFVGSNGASSALVVSNGAQLGNSQAMVGVVTSSTNNAVLITGAGSLWSNRLNVIVGQNGSFNRVRVGEGGRVVSTRLDLGLNGSDNEVTVAGPNSTWSNGDNGIVLGSSRNLLRVSNGGTMTVGSFATISPSAATSSNTALVTDAGSRWTIGTSFFVGVGGAFNRLVISNGGAVFSSSGNLGNLSTSDDNVAIVTGAGSLWSNANNLSVGVAGARNRLFVTNGGTVSGSNVVVGFDGASFNNRVLVDGGTLRVASASGTGALDVRRGTNVLNAGLVDVDRLVLTNAAGVFEFKGGTLVTRGASITNGSGMIVGPTGAGPALWDVRPGPFDHLVNLGVLVGLNSSFNQLFVSGGAVLSNRISGFVGSGTGANSNTATISGAGSRWQVAGDVGSGSGGAFNRLTVSDGGSVGGTNGYVGGAQFASSNNVAIVTGAGSVWSLANSLLVGDASPGNQLLVSDGARVSNQAGTVGNSDTASNNVVLVTGAASVWNNAERLTVGLGGAASQLIVSNGGMVVASTLAEIGGFSANNQAVVTDPGSVLDTGNFGLSVGVFRGGNRLLVRKGGLVSGDFGYVGLGSDSNAVIITGATSLWNNRLDQIVGNTGARNQLLMTDGGMAFTGGDGIIGQFTNAISNTVLVTDAGSRWLITSNLLIGNHGSFNRLVVSNGAFVGSLVTAVGREAEASNNLALVSGPGSVWTNSSLFVGFSGTGNQLVVSNGGSVVSRAGIVGGASSGANNVALVTGAGSVWSIANAFNVGGQGAFQRLVVSNAGQVVSGFGYIGNDSGSNEVIITGAGSLWSNRFDVSVGHFGSANRLVVNDGGTVLGRSVFVGFDPGSTNNRVVLNGGTLRATNATGTGVLDVGRGTNVLNSGLIDVDNLVLTNKGTIPVFSTFSNNGLITIPILGGATPYPSTITVQGFVGVATKVVVTLSNLTHPRPDDLDILLVGPAGQRVMLMSDAGGTTAITNVSLTLDADAAATLPDSFSFAPGIYRPVDYQPGDTMPAPAPAGPYSADLASFNGSNPNGLWSLYIVDANSLSAFNGAILGWTLRIDTDQGPFVDSGAFEFNGGTLVTRGAVIDNRMPFVVGGPGGVPAAWEVRPGAGIHAVARDVTVGSAAFTNNLLHVIGGTLNAGALDLRGGTNRLDAGIEDVARLTVTNTHGQFEFNGGSLRTPNTTVANGRVFTVGNGTSTATLQLLGGTHTFANNLVIAGNASLVGNGLIDGTVSVSTGGRLVPGAPIGRIDSTETVILQGAAVMQIDKSGGVRTQDQLAAAGAIFYGGTLTVTDIGSDVLAAGDRFQLFSATPYAGTFATLNLPPLAPGLSWANNLAVDGSIAVVAGGQPGIASITLSGVIVVLTGTNGTPGANYSVLTATNVALPLSNWVSIATNQFDANGRFAFTNAIVPGMLQRFFRLAVQ